MSAAETGSTSARIEPSSSPAAIVIATLSRHSADDRMEVVAEVRIEDRRRGDLTPDDGVVADPRIVVELGEQGRLDGLVGVALGNFAIERVGGRLLSGVGEGRPDESVAILEVVVEKRGRDAGLRGHLLDPEAPHAVGRDHPRGRLEDRRPVVWGGTFGLRT